MVRKNMIFAEEKTNREVKGGKYLEKENVCFVEEKKGGKGKRRINLEKENIFFRSRRKKEKENSIITGQTNNRTRKDRATQPMDHERLR